MITTWSSVPSSDEPNIGNLLYDLCKKNEIEKIRKIIPFIGNKNIINQIQTSTGSTCLHVACYYGHRDVVEILLDYGALRSIRNLRHNLTPYEEAHTDSTKQLFLEQRKLFSNNDYDYIEWSLVGDDLLDKRRSFRQIIDVYKTYDNHTLISKLIAEFIHYYLNDYLLNLSSDTSNPEDRVTPEQIKTLEAYFKGAIEEKDYLTYFIKAYTLTSGFHKVLNRHLALYILDYFDESKLFLPTYRLVNCLAHIVTLLIHHPDVSRYQYRGLCYRGMVVTQNDLDQYKLNQHMLNRSFISTSLDRGVAEMFAGEGQQPNMRYTPKGENALQYSCLCQYLIKQNATAINIQTLSINSDEKEVLILPFTVFKVVAIKRNDLYNPTAQISIEIELEECEDSIKKTKQRKCFGINRLLLSVLLVILSMIVFIAIAFALKWSRIFNGSTTTSAWQNTSDVSTILSAGSLSILPPNSRPPLSNTTRTTTVTTKSATTTPPATTTRITTPSTTTTPATTTTPPITTLATTTPATTTIPATTTTTTTTTTPATTSTAPKPKKITIAGGNGLGNQLNQLNGPRGIFIDDNQTIYIADDGNNRIVEWKLNATNGRIVAGGNQEENRNNQLNNPTDVIIDKESNSLIICDHENNRVMQWSRQNDQDVQIIIENIDCFGLAMDKNGYLYVSDLTRNEVTRRKIGEKKETVVTDEDERGTKHNQVSSPSFIFVDDDLSLYVSDRDNNRVMKWLKNTKKGIVVAGGGSGRGTDSLTKLFFPAGIVVDQFGQIYVADSSNHRVMRWQQGAKEGTIVAGGHGNGNLPNQLSYPTGLSFDRQGNLYVADHGNNRIQKIEINKNTND
ncbi:unnamed protein product [Adineta steineri]|uniref:NAD(P)(+)--arginine ADP-ribosyltransferase n=1 Tax=Adineta steineri TaxID=433720 RepID=A0A815QU28_9BILA|nr:unnamed protein product [Adineta steineri]CAF1634987.1 unnamed protein product [Adineta steineri]